MRSPSPGSPWCSAESDPYKTPGRGSRRAAENQTTSRFIQIPLFILNLTAVKRCMKVRHSETLFEFRHAETTEKSNAAFRELEEA